MKVWSEFYADVLPSVMGCPAPVMDHNLRRAAQNFFQRTHVWTQWLDSLKTSGTAEYNLPLEPLSELVKLQRATLNGREIAMLTPESLPADWQTSPNSVRSGLFTRDRKTLTLFPQTSTGQLLRIEATLMPANTAIGIRDDLFDLYVDVITNGAKARIKRLSGTEFFNPGQALECDQMVNDAVGRLNIQRFRAFSSAAPRQKIKTF